MSRLIVGSGDEIDIDARASAAKSRLRVRHRRPWRHSHQGLEEQVSCREDVPLRNDLSLIQTGQIQSLREAVSRGTERPCRGVLSETSHRVGGAAPHVRAGILEGGQETGDDSRVG